MAAGKGWYRYRLLYGTTINKEHFDIEIVLHKKGDKGLVDFSKEEAESILKSIGNYMAGKADFKNLREDF